MPTPCRTGPWTTCLLAGLACGATALDAAVVINEIHYNSPGATDIEYVELYNDGTQPQNLTGWFLLDDNDTNPPCALSGTLAPSAYLVVAGRLDLFVQAYPGVPVHPVALDGNPPGTGFALGNSGDRVRLFSAPGTLADEVPYSDVAPWPTLPDGDGPSLELRNPHLDNAQATSWAASVDLDGTPGAVNSTFLDDPAPSVGGVERSPALPRSTDAVRISAVVSDDDASPLVELFVDDGSGFAPQPMRDDGVGGDAVAGDGRFTATLAPRANGTLVRYYLAATDTLPQTVVLPQGAPAAYFGYTVGHTPPALWITEILTSNQGVNVDESGETDDWVELFNPGPSTVALGGLFLSDEAALPMKWMLPPLDLAAGARVLVWCDAQPGQGPLHAIFRLSSERGEVRLHDTVEHGNVEIDGFTYGPQTANVSFGRRPDGARHPEYLLTATPLASNDGATLFARVCLNELLAGSQLPGARDWVELYNRSAMTVDLGGLGLTDDPAQPVKYTFPAGVLLAPGARLSLDETQLGFALSLDGSDVLSLTSEAGLVGQDWLDFGPQLEDVSLGRLPDGGPLWHAFAPSSRDLPNVCPSLSPIGPVNGLVATAPDAWLFTERPSAEAYDMVRGDLTMLRTTRSVGPALQRCLSDDRRDAQAWDPELPAPGRGWFYLVRGVNFACRFGTYDSGHPSQTVPRDASIAASALACR